MAKTRGTESLSERRDRRKEGLSYLAALAAALTAGLLAALVFHGAHRLALLESHNEIEGLLNSLLGGLRDHEDFSAILEASPTLGAAIVGVGVYSSDGSLLSSWGKLPANAADELTRAGGENAEGRRYIERPGEKAIVLLIRTSRLWPPPPKPPHYGPEPPRPSIVAEQPHDRGGFFDILRRSEFVRLEVRQAEYFRGERARSFLLPASLLAILALALGARRLIARNAQYRADLEAQRNLVVLGTAAATLAHEIKNPLLSIRLQTSLLAKTLPAPTPEELGLIDAEVERLGSLSRRIGDFLRDPRGEPVALSLADIATECARRVLGAEIELEGPGVPRPVAADPERLRSIVENLVRNALESGGRTEDIRIRLDGDADRARLEILDRGRGIEGANVDRLFDPFYTTKSSGSGIGLAVSRRFARAAGGEVVIETREGGGARSLLFLPFAAADDPRAGAGS